MPAFTRDSANHSALAAADILDVSAFVASGLPGAAGRTRAAGDD
jgi:hypothetical protein